MDKALKNIEALRLDIQEIGAKLQKSNELCEDLTNKNMELRVELDKTREQRKTIEQDLQAAIAKLTAQRDALREQLTKAGIDPSG